MGCCDEHNDHTGSRALPSCKSYMHELHVSFRSRESETIDFAADLSHAGINQGIHKSSEMTQAPTKHRASLTCSVASIASVVLYLMPCF
eukprot:915932-Pelagomonas_calceolata.AAC.2